MLLMEKAQVITICPIEEVTIYFSCSQNTSTFIRCETVEELFEELRHLKKTFSHFSIYIKAKLHKKDQNGSYIAQ